MRTGGKADFVPFDNIFFYEIRYTLKMSILICVDHTTQILCDSNFAQILIFFTQSFCGFHKIAQKSIKIIQIHSKNHANYLCTDFLHYICVTSLADTEIFVRITIKIFFHTNKHKFFF
jgi:hypothetical protein